MLREKKSSFQSLNDLKTISQFTTLDRVSELGAHYSISFKIALYSALNVKSGSLINV